MGAEVTLTLRDSYGRIATPSFEFKDNSPSEADVQDLAAKVAAVTKLGVESASVSWTPDITPSATTAEAGANRQVDAFLQALKSGGGTHTFNLFDPKAALIQAEGKLDLTAASLIAFTELFDDGAGLAAVPGDWRISDGEQLVEGTGGDNMVKGGLRKN